jgi:hypothetical protein
VHNVTDGNVRIMIDARHSYFQPAIDAIAKVGLLDRPVVPLLTYQCYLRTRVPTQR